MTLEENRPLHPLVAKLLSSILETPELQLREDRAARACATIVRHPGRRVIAAQLIAVVARLANADQRAQALYLCRFAVAALGDTERAASAFERAGMSREAARRLIDSSGPNADARLAPPAPGVGLRKPRGK